MRSFFTPRLGLLAGAHFTIDAYSSFFSPLLPLLVVRLNMSLADVGALVALASLSSSFAQPLYGWISDRLARPWFVAFGPLVAALFLSAVGLASSYAALVGLLLLGGVGVAAFHPQAAALASEGSARRSLAMSFFVGGGTLGFSLGPLLAVTLVSVAGLERTWLAAIPGLIVCIVLFAWFRRVPARPRHTIARPPLAELRPVARPLALLYTAVVCRSAVSYGFMVLLPLYLASRGVAVEAGGAMLTAYLLAGAIGGFVGGWMSDRIGGRRVIVQSFLGATPLYLAFLYLPPGPGLACLVAGSFVLQGSLPVNVVMGQELSPRHASTISSLLMGGAWGVGALLIGPIGALGDVIGLRGALTVLGLLGFVGFACAVALPVRTCAHPHPVDPVGPCEPQVAEAAAAPVAASTPPLEPAAGRSGMDA